MTDEELKDRIAIQGRLAICTQAGDARKADAYADSFAQDGVLQLDTAIAGREAIRAWMRGPSVIPPPRADDPAPEKPAGFISHHLTTCTIELVGNGEAKVRTYWLVTSAAGLDHNGYYDDLLRKVDGAWLIAHRKPRTLWISPASVLRG